MPPRMLRRLLIGSMAALALWGVPPLAAQPAKFRTVRFCFWNVENLFDDRVNPKLEKVDREFDQWFAKDKEALHHKLDRMADVLLSREMNRGVGPDVLAMAEVESLRAVELVRDALNAKLKDKALHYKHIAYLDPRGGRSIATAVLSRVPFAKDKPPRLLGRSQRMLEVTLVEGKYELVVMASHWTSRVSDGRGTGRASYAEQIYRNFAETYKKSPGVKYLVCGDFNDAPTDESVARHLNATGDVKKVLCADRGRPAAVLLAVRRDGQGQEGDALLPGTTLHLRQHLPLAGPPRTGRLVLRPQVGGHRRAAPVPRPARPLRRPVRQAAVAQPRGQRPLPRDRRAAGAGLQVRRKVKAGWAVYAGSGGVARPESPPTGPPAEGFRGRGSIGE